jgi:microcystin degradation protein MlrC
MRKRQRFRVAILVFHHESNTFVDGETGRIHFEEDLLASGDSMKKELGKAPHEAGGFFKVLQEEGIEAVPVFAARAYAFGVVTTDAFAELVAQMLDELKAAGPIDGVLAAAHGFVFGETHRDGAGHWLSRVREMIGPEKPLIATLDPHTNLSPEMVRATDALVAYRTNPHVDQWETGERAARLMVRTLRGEIMPTQTAAFPPMAINILCQNTSESPLKDLYEWASILDTEPSVLSQSILFGFSYADVPTMGPSVVVVTDGNLALAERLTRGMAEDMWSRREQFVPAPLDVQQAFNEVLVSGDRILLLDMGDNVGAGAPGHGTHLLKELQGRRIGSSLIFLHDPDSVGQAVEAGVGASFELRLGGVCDGLHGRPVTAKCKVISLHDGRFEEFRVRYGGVVEFDQGRTAVVETDRGVTVMLTSRRVPPFSMEQLQSCGLNPGDFKVFAVKGVIAPLATYGPVVDRVIPVNTPGVTCAELKQLPFHSRRKPMFPFEANFHWEPAEVVTGHPLGIPLQPFEGGDTGPLPSSTPLLSHA